MSLFLFRFWPVLIPLVIYLLWHWRAVARAKKQGTTPPSFRDGPWYWVILSMLGIALVCFLFLGLTHDAEKGQYVPPRLEDGRVVPGHIER
jgi:hypothetical protein